MVNYGNCILHQRMHQRCLRTGQPAPRNWRWPRFRRWSPPQLDAKVSCWVGPFCELFGSCWFIVDIGYWIYIYIYLFIVDLPIISYHPIAVKDVINQLTSWGHQVVTSSSWPMLDTLYPVKILKQPYWVHKNWFRLFHTLDTHPNHLKSRLCLVIN